MDLFTFKKLVGVMFMPLPISTLLLIIAVFALFTHRKRIASFSGLTGLGLLIISTTPLIPDMLLGKIETKHPQFDLSRPVSHIVVLGCSHVNNGTLPLTAQIHRCSIVRVTEALRIYQQNPRAKLITSGAASHEVYSNAEMNKRLLVALGVEESNIITISSPRDTNDESKAMAKLLKGKPFALVTAASHMPRSVRLFKAQGLDPVPAPTGHLVRAPDSVNALYHMPNSKHAQKLERWWYETLGQSWITIRTWWSS